MTLVSSAMVAARRGLGGPTDLASRATLLAGTALLLADWAAVRRHGGRQLGLRIASDRGTYFWIQAWQGAAIAVALACPLLLGAANISPAIWPLGIAVALLGIGFRVWAITTLGRCFRRVVTVDRDQRVIDTGPYHWVRHPSYTGLLLVILGMAIAQANLLSILGALALALVAYVRRIRVEENELKAQLGDRYRAYAMGRARLVPHVW